MAMADTTASNAEPSKPAPAGVTDVSPEFWARGRQKLKTAFGCSQPVYVSWAAEKPIVEFGVVGKANNLT